MSGQPEVGQGAVNRTKNALPADVANRRIRPGRRFPRGALAHSCGKQCPIMVNNAAWTGRRSRLDQAPLGGLATFRPNGGPVRQGVAEVPATSPREPISDLRRRPV